MEDKPDKHAGMLPFSKCDFKSLFFYFC